jgi:pilus assembly protein FimV
LRISYLLMALAALLASADALALGLGGLRTQSALNSPFYGEIDLIGVNRDQLDNVTARLASDEEFEKAGVDRPHFLTRLRFETMVGTSGRPIIQVTSREPVREPYMDFLVEVIWPEGTLVKEYAVLLDPPGTTGRPAPAIATPSVAEQSTEAEGPSALPTSPPQTQPASSADRRPSPLARPSPSQPSSEPSGDELIARATDAALAETDADRISSAGRETSPTETASPDDRPTPSSRPLAPEQPPDSVASSPPRTPPPAPTAVASTSSAGPQYPLRYGPIRRGDGLLRVARDLTPPGATVEQTAMALYRNNQHAFIGGDVNKLVVGPTMTIPSKAELFALDPEEARGELERALAGAKVRSSPIAAVETPESGASTDTPEEPQLKIVGAPQAATTDSADEASPVGEDAVTVDTQEVVTESLVNVATREVAGLQEDLLLVRETSEANRQETYELRERIAGLEQQLADIKRLLEVQAEIASLQLERTRAQMQEGQPAGANDAASAPPPPDDIPEASADVGGTVASVIDAIPLNPILVGGALIVVGGLGTFAWSRRRRLAAPSPDDDLFAQREGAEPRPSPPVPPTPKERSAVAPSSAPQSASTKASAVAAAAALGTSGSRQDAAPAARHGLDSEATRSASEAPGSETVAEPEGMDGQAKELDDLALDHPSPKAAASLHSVEAANSLGIDAQPGFVSGVGPDVEPGQAETQEADVISEADIYILYGRYREAESLLLEELSTSPDRLDIKYKLAEAYVAGENRQGLASLVEQMRGAGEDAYDLARWHEIEHALGDTPTAPAAEPSLPSASVPWPRPATESVGRPVEARRPAETSRSLLESSLELVDERDARFVDADNSARQSDGHGSGAADSGELELELIDPGAPGPTGETGSHTDHRATDFGTGVDLEAAEVEELDLELMGLEGLEDLLDRQPEAPSFDGDTRRGGTAASESFGKIASAASDGRGDEPEVDLADPLASPRSLEAASASAPERTLPPVSERARDTADDPFAAIEYADLEPKTDEAEPRLEGGVSNGVSSSPWQIDAGAWDEVGTKMDLARAYIEMEDPDAARAILEEIMADGSDEQRSAAKAILRELE